MVLAEISVRKRSQTIGNQFSVQWVKKDQPQVVCHIKFKVDPKSTSSIESDRSYSNIGFLVKGLLINDIEEEAGPFNLLGDHLPSLFHLNKRKRLFIHPRTK